MEILEAALKLYKDLMLKDAVLIELAEVRKEDRYFIRAYICDGPCRQVVDQIGTSTFAEIFVRRPSGCRYAIVEPVDRKHYMVVDLYDTRVDGLQVYMGNNTIYPTLDAAIAAPMLNYTRN